MVLSAKLVDVTSKMLAVVSTRGHRARIFEGYTKFLKGDYRVGHLHL
jgi:hypothetical protein